jgi:FtsH-binding integral membrane protein
MTGLAIAYAGAALAAAPSNQPSNQGQEFGSSSPVALVVLILFFVAMAFLARSMSKHLKRVPKSFDVAEDQPQSAEADQASGSAATEPSSVQPLRTRTSDVPTPSRDGLS